MCPDTELFRTVADKDYLDLLVQGEPRVNRVADFLDLDDKDIANATGVPRASVRLLSGKVPEEVVERTRVWAQALNLVAQFFGGDSEKTVQWFKVTNPLLGGITPRDMIRLGRFHRLAQFIREALADAHVSGQKT